MSNIRPVTPVLQMGVFSFPRFIRLVLHSGFPYRSATAFNQLSGISASLQYTTSHYVESPFIPCLLVALPAWWYTVLITVVITVLITALKSLQQQAFLCLSFGSTAKVSLHFIAPLNVTASRLLASLRHQSARAPFHKFQYARAFILPCLPSFPCHCQHWRFTHFFSHQRFLSHVSAESEHLPESVTYSYQQGVSTRCINKVYQQGVSTGWRLTKSLRHTVLFPSFLIVPFNF